MTEPRILDMTAAVSLPGDRIAYQYTFFMEPPPETFWRYVTAHAETMQRVLADFVGETFDLSKVHWFLNRPFPLLSPEDML